MRTRGEIEAIIGSHRENERTPIVAQALLEVMLDIREALLNKEEATDAYFNATKAFEKVTEEQANGEQQMKEETKTANDGHPGWTCQDAHSPISHEQWVHGQTIYENSYGVESPDGLELGGAADQVAEAKAEQQTGQDPYEVAEIDAADQQDHTPEEYP